MECRDKPKPPECRLMSVANSGIPTVHHRTHLYPEKFQAQFTICMDDYFTRIHLRRRENDRVRWIIQG